MIERSLDVFFATGSLGRIRNAPVLSARLSWEIGAGFGRGLIADRDDEIEWLMGHLVPGFTAWLARRNAVLFQHLEGAGMNGSGRMTSGTVGLMPSLAQVIDEGFRHDGAAGVSCAEDEDFLNPCRHYVQQLVESVVDCAVFGLAKTSGVQQADSASETLVETISASSIVR